MKLGGKSKDLDSFVDKLREEGTGEKISDNLLYILNVLY